MSVNWQVRQLNALRLPSGESIPSPWVLDEGSPSGPQEAAIEGTEAMVSSRSWASRSQWESLLLVVPVASAVGVDLARRTAEGRSQNQVAGTAPPDSGVLLEHLGR